MNQRPVPSKPPDTPPPRAGCGFDRRANRGLLRELLGFVWQNRLWWLVPVVVVLALLALLMAAAAVSGGAAPFIYTLF